MNKQQRISFERAKSLFPCAFQRYEHTPGVYKRLCINDETDAFYVVNDELYVVKTITDIGVFTSKFDNAQRVWHSNVMTS